mgnify:CR=1 FL=1
MIYPQIKYIKIFKMDIKNNFKTFVIAEAGVNHNGDIKLAKN